MVDGAGVVEEVAALERDLVALAPRVGVVHADGINPRDTRLRAHHVLAHAPTGTAAARRTRDAEDILEREVLLVDVVEQADDGDTAVAAEDVGVAADDVLVRGAGLGVGFISIAAVELAELALTHVLVRHDVDGLVALAVVHAREFGRIAQLVEDLDALHGLGRQRLDGRRDILAEKLLAVDEDFLHLLALGLDRAVGNRDTGHLLEQTLDVGIGRDLEGAGVVAQRIAPLRGPERLRLLDHRGYLHTGLQRDFAQTLARRRDGERTRFVIITQEGDFDTVLPVGESRNGHRTLVARCKKALRIGRLRRRDLQHGARDGFTRLGIDNRRRDASLLGKGRNRKEARQ